MESQWKEQFPPHILQRGKDYFASGAVAQLIPWENGYRARVNGSELYIVEIHSCSEHGLVADCTCPYAEQNEYCKHMAAVMFQLEADGLLKNRRKKSSETSESLESVIARLTEDQLRKELLAFAMEQESIRSRLMLRYAVENKGKQLIRLKKEIARITHKYTKRSRSLSWSEVSEYTNEMTTFLRGNMTILLEKGECRDAFELVGEGLLAAEKLWLDAPREDLEDLTYSCLEMWKEILGRSSPEERGHMLSWLMKQRLAHIDKEYMENDLDELIMDEFHSPALLKEKLSYFDTLIDNLSEKYAFHSYHRSDIEQAILNRLYVMHELGLSAEETNAFKQKFWKYPQVRQQQIDEYMADGNSAAAIELLKESKLMDSAFASCTISYIEQLIDIYRSSRMLAECKGELIARIFDYHINNLDYLLQLKELCTQAEWAQYREDFLDKPCPMDLKLELLAEEGLYERLMSIISSAGSIRYLDHYEKILKPLFTERIRDCYMDYVIREAKPVSDRKRYQELAQYLKKICTYPDGQELAEGIVTVWRSAYAKRRAMMDELKSAGF